MHLVKLIVREGGCTSHGRGDIFCVGIFDFQVEGLIDFALDSDDVDSNSEDVDGSR